MMFDKMVVVLFLLLSIQMMVNGQTSPTGCTYVNNAGLGIGVYECDFNAITLPLAYSSFSSPRPQRLKIYNIHGHLPASNPTASFSGFSAFAGNLDPDYAASLELRCATGGTLLLYAGTFTGMSYLQRLSIYNCAIQSGFPSSGFMAIGTLDYFLVYGGSLTTLATDAFSGLYIQKLSIPDAKGELALVGVTMPSTTLPQGLFYSLTDIVSIRLDNIGLTAITSDVFSQNTLLEKISLTYNAFTEVPSTIFDGLTKLYSVDFMGTSWNCTCDNIWLVNYVNSSGMRLETGLTCTTPSLYAQRTGKEFYIKECDIPDPCQTEGKGIRFGVECFTLYNIIAYCVLLLALIIGGLALGIVCHVRRDLITDREKLMKKRNIAWMKVQDALLRGGGGGQRPPASTNPPARKGW